MKKLVIGLSILTLVGCKAEIEKNISLNSLLNEPLKTELAELKVEVASCHDHQDSRKPSNSLLQVQAKLPQLFNTAKFKECYSSNFDSFAVFEIPVGIGELQKGITAENDINLVSKKEEGNILFLGAKKSLKERLNDFIRSEPMIRALKPSITLYLTNDLKSEQTLNIVSSYINDVPYMKAQSLLKPNETLKIKLSDVATDQLLSLDENAMPVYLITQ